MFPLKNINSLSYLISALHFFNTNIGNIWGKVVKTLVAIVYKLCTYYHGYCRNDEKTAADYKVTGGSVLHLVLALRGGL